MSPDPSPPRCAWPGQDPLYVAYHDEEWGEPVRDGRALFEKLVLDGFQAGLAWITILRKRPAFQTAFRNFEPEVLARFAEADVERLMGDPGIVRSRAKINAAIGNARAFLAMEEAGEEFSSFLWSFVDDAPLQSHRGADEPAPVKTDRSEALSKALVRRGFKFCGPVIVYAFMQAVGMVNDHASDCFRYAELGGNRGG